MYTRDQITAALRMCDDTHCAGPACPFFSEAQCLRIMHEAAANLLTMDNLTQLACPLSRSAGRETEATDHDS